MRTNFCMIFIMCILLLFTNSCENKCIVKNIEVSVLLSSVTNKKSINYCELLRKALTGDENSIKKISLLELDNAVGYDHGAVIVDLVTTLGETEYIKAISKINSEQKKIIHSYIDVGLEYGNNSLIKGKKFKSAFPDLYIFLKE